jgi:alkanesulfonate monooxygenase SsuD/methylene tetrahydromethanopterin reductase-like flavin-dependent oxidoreductase (luciferase family)
MPSPLETHERFIRDRLEDPRSRKAEALNWLEGGDGKNTLGELGTTQEAIALVKAIYDAGAAEVLAVEIQDYDGAQNSGKLVIKLPADRRLRQQVFEWHGNQAESMGFDAEPDIGQSHLFSMLD